ncbi:MAG: pseudouridine-5'-phosphate glycosidase [Deltaproteobacteria bacterium]|nr:pseudouridine-5'-phosphate glycosidase [Deltaproteobacteria bacterium]
MKKEAVKLSPEVASALAEGRPVVALESSVLAQGLPPPHNLDSWRTCERAVREAGAVPAVTALVAGEIRAGLTSEEVDRLVAPETKTRKVGVRDLAPAMASGRWGATTVSATCAIADAAGIALFATGGIGGVHRGAEKTFDVSQDLATIARSRVAVVTAGAKAILDLPKTLEVLEALGVPVVGYRTQEFPAFYTSSSGESLEQRVDDPGSAAALLRARWDVLGEGGVLFANPIPAEAEADPEVVARAIDEALVLADAQGIKGKAVTPYLLAEVARRSGGESLRANLALLASNARVAAEIAVAYALRRRP